MVWILMPPGVSRARANRARARRGSAAGSSILASSAASRASSITAQAPSSWNSRRCISAAAALVKVTQSTASGRAPRSSSRATRRTRVEVLPEPALAATNTEAAGSEA
jgi:predicted RNase H-like nuclease